MPGQRLLCVRRGGLGDTLLMVPVLRALRRRHPERSLHFAGVLDFAVLLAHYGVVDKALSSEDLAVWSRGAGASWWRDYDLVVADDPTFRTAANRTTTVESFDPRPRDHRPLPLQIAGQLQLELQWPQDAWLRSPTGAVAGPVVLAPGSGGRAKCWPRERWLALATTLVGRGQAVEVLVGPVELERDDPRRWSWPAAVAFVVEADLVVVAQRLERASAFVGNDSGTSHLAAMLGVPTVAIFGPSDPAVFAPVGPRVTVLGGNDPGFCVDVASVLAAGVAAH